MYLHLYVTTILCAVTATTTTQHQLKSRKHLNDKNLLQDGTKIIDHYRVLEISYDDGATYEQPENIQEIPDFGIDATFTNVDGADEENMRYVPGIPTPKSLDLVYKRIGTSSLQDNLIDAAQNNKSVKLRVTYKSGDISESDAMLGGFYMGSVGDGNDVQMFGLTAQLSGAVTHSKIS